MCIPNKTLANFMLTPLSDSVNITASLENRTASLTAVVKIDLLPAIYTVIMFGHLWKIVMTCI